MTEKVRDKIMTAVFSVVSSAVIFALGFWATGIRLTDEKINNRIDQKVDKVQYYDDCKKVDMRIDRVEITVKDYAEQNQELMKLLYEMNNKLGRIETDVTWLKQRIK